MDMRLVLALCIPAVWLWAIALAFAMHDFFNQEVYKDFTSFALFAQLLFPTIAIAITIVIVGTIKTISNK
tara:strand:- start:888 stop:1097 length:210 start_codon:yes stop_codon:yes gene_type:complete